MFLEMKVFGLTVDPATNEPILILKDASEDNILPVWIGEPEARAIAAQIEQVHFERPMTHDLIKDMLSSLNVRINRVELTNIKDSVYYAIIHMTNEHGNHIVDARPSDAIAIALRTSSPIFVDSDLFKRPEEGAAVPEEPFEKATHTSPGRYKM